MLGHRHAGSGHGEGRGGGDVEGVLPVAPGATGVDEDLPVDPHVIGAGPHHLGGAGDLLDRLPLEPERGQEGADLGRGGAAVGHLAHQLHHLGAGQVAAGDQPRDGREDHARLHAFTRESQLPSSALPCPVRIDSG
jgi:hypothetical protein